MMKIHRIRYLQIMVIGLVLTASTGNAQNQPDTSTYHIETSGGNTYMGKILEQDSLKIRFNTDNLGPIRILRSDIRKMYPVNPEKIIEGKYWFENPQATRYLYSPNGYGLKKGEGYYQNVWVLFSSFAVGLTDNISIGGAFFRFFFLPEKRLRFG